MDDVLTESPPIPHAMPLASRARRAPLTVEVYGVTVRVTGISSGVRSQVAALLRPFALRGARASVHADLTIHVEPWPENQYWRVYINGAFLTAHTNENRLASFIEWLVISRAIERSTAYVAFHAASVARRRQAAILIAASGSGKSTLTVGLLRKGWKPLADDLTTVDVSACALHPFRRCFHTDAFTRTVGDVSHPLVTPVAGLHDYTRPTHWASAGCAPRWVVVVRRDTTAPSLLTPITRATAAAALFTSSIRNALDRSAVARLSAEIASRVEGCWELNNSDLDTALDLLDHTLRPARGS